MKLGTTKIDNSLVTDGVWTTFVIQRTGDSVKLKMALADTAINTSYQKALRSAMSEHDRTLSFYTKASEMPQKLVQEITAIGREVFAAMIVVDWQGVEDASGKPMPYSAQGLNDLFLEFPELRSQAEEEAKKVERYRVAVLDAQAGNSRPA